MFKTKYYYDSKTLSYRKIKVSKRVQLRNILAFLFTSAFFGIVVLFVLIQSPLLNTPTELSQSREISNYKFTNSLEESFEDSSLYIICNNQ